MQDSSFSFDAPAQKTIFLLEACPDFIWTEDLDIPSFLLKNAHSSALALPSSGGAETAILIEVPCVPEKAFLEALGWIQQSMEIPFSDILMNWLNSAGSILSSMLLCLCFF